MHLVTRFAPSPTGELHLGSAYSALIARQRARAANGTFLVRIEDIDIRRCKREYETAMLEDLQWLGLTWDGKMRHQSDHFADYGQALDRLDARGLVYPCFCTRADIAASANAPHGPDGPIYPGTCRHLSPAERRERRLAGREHCLRLDVEKAAKDVGSYHFVDEARGRFDGEPMLFGDFVIARKDTPTSYHLAVTVDDHLQGVTLVTRGEDLLASTHVHVLLQKLLGYATPAYAHHRLLLGPDGKRLAKRDQSTSIRALRQAGKTPAEVFSLLPKD
jgi:glutamyl-Q tRNA(Asp) synthetase